MAIEIVDCPIKNGGSFHGKMWLFTRPGTQIFNGKSSLAMKIFHPPTKLPTSEAPARPPATKLCWKGACFVVERHRTNSRNPKREFHFGEIDDLGTPNRKYTWEIYGKSQIYRSTVMVFLLWFLCGDLFWHVGFILKRKVLTWSRRIPGRT